MSLPDRYGPIYPAPAGRARRQASREIGLLASRAAVQRVRDQLEIDRAADATFHAQTRLIGIGAVAAMAIRDNPAIEVEMRIVTLTAAEAMAHVIRSGA